MQSLAIIAVLGMLAGSALAFAGDSVKLPQKSAYALGKCNNEQVKVLPALDIEKYNGTWYEIYRVPFIGEVLNKCVSAEYTAHPENKTVGVVNHGYVEFVNRWTEVDGVATATNAAEPAKLSIKFNVSPARTGSYWVLDTDYTSYSVVYSCHEIGPFRSKNAWILSRTNTPLNQDIQNTLFRTLSTNGVDINTLFATVQTDCPPRP